MERILLLSLVSWNLLLVFGATYPEDKSWMVRSECISVPKWKGKWTGENVTITSWLPPEKEGKAEVGPFLRLNLKEHGNKPRSHRDYIEFWRKNVTFTSSREGTVRTWSYKEEIPEGWVHISLSMIDGHVTLQNLDHQNLLVLPWSSEYIKLTAIGKYVTLNCNEQLTAWSVANYNGPVSIPLSRTSLHTHLTLWGEYGNNTRPVISFPSAPINMVQVTWNGSHIVGIPLSSPDMHLQPLTAHIKHDIYIFCESREENVECKGTVDGNKIVPWNIQLQNMPQFLTVEALSGRVMVLVHHEKTSKILETSTLQDEERVVIVSLVEDTVGYKSKTPGQIAALVIISLVFTGIFALIIVSSARHDYIVKTHDKRPFLGHLFLTEGEEQGKESDEDEEINPFLPHREIPQLLPRGSIIMEEQNLWEAVQEDDIEVVKSLLSQGYHPDEVEVDRFTTPLMDAHMLGLRDIVQEFSKFKGEKYTTAPDDLIKSVSYELERNMKEIFLAAEVGMYDHVRGVESLLKAYCLPATIMDNKGRTILHYMASVTAMDGIPVWQPKDIRKFFSNHEVYPNAVDHYGRTALHELAQHPQEVEADIIWDGKEWELADAWLAMARILVSYECDPRIPDHKGRLPDQLASEAGNHELATFLKQKCLELGNICPEASIEKFGDLVSAIKLGDTKRTCKLLLEHVPLLPISAQVDPLVEAIHSQQRDTMILLLSAGAPLCNRSIGETTPLEAAHNILGLPACFPALLRKTFYESMEDEIALVSQEDESLKSLRQCMTAYNLQVMDVGSKARWIFPSKSGIDRGKEAKHLLLQASELGLSITCQLLGLENVYLHALPDEVSPFQKTVEHHHVNTQLVLYREVCMSPFTLEWSESENLSWEILEELWVQELRTLENACRWERDNDLKATLKEAIINLKQLRDENVWSLADQSEDTLHLLLYTVTKFGLVTILHVILSHFETLEVNKVIIYHCQYTMMHVASAFGKINVLEYLLHIGAASDILCLGNYTPAHVAAATGHRKCCEFILDYMKVQGVELNAKCCIGLTTGEIMSKYEKLCNDSNFPLISHEDSLFIKNERKEDMRAYEILQRRGNILNITTPDSLSRLAGTRACKRPDLEDTERLVLKEIQHLGEQLSETGCQGEIIPVGSFHDGYEMFNITQINFIYEISDIGTNENISYEDIRNDEKVTISIESDSKNSVYYGHAFLNLFQKKLSNLLTKFESVSSDIFLVPPFLERESNGIYLYWMLVIREQTRLVRTLIIPALPISCPVDDVNRVLPTEFKRFSAEKSDIPIHLINDSGEWIYYSCVLERITFQNLTRNQKAVWVTCLLLTRLLQRTWWSPSYTIRHQSKPWHTMSLSVPTLPERGLRSLFLEELVEVDEWDKSHIFKRVVSIFGRACKHDLRGKWVPREFINYFLTPRHYCCNVRESVCGVLEYLEELARSAPQVPDKTVKFAEP